jgi:hypothetical protein
VPLIVTTWELYVLEDANWDNNVVGRESFPLLASKIISHQLATSPVASVGSCSQNLKSVIPAEILFDK